MFETIELTKFYKEHQLADYSSEFLIAWEDMIQDYLKTAPRIPGYRDGVILLKVPSQFRHTTVTLAPEEIVYASFSPRVVGEFPRKRMYVERIMEELPIAVSTFVVLYRRDVLAEEGCIIGSGWGAVTHLTSSIETPEPMHPDTMIANHFGFDGGTSTNMAPQEFEAILRESVHFWKDKVTASVLKPL